MFQHPFFSLFQIELINASLLDNLEKLLAGLKVINLSLHGFAKPLKVISVQSPQFLGQDRIVIQDTPTEGEAAKDGAVDSKDKTKKTKKNKEDDIPEFEGEYD